MGKRAYHPRLYVKPCTRLAHAGMCLQDLLDQVNAKSGALGEEKARNAAASGADELVACDLSCLLHIAGRARRTGVPLRVRHLAEVLAG